MINKEVNKELQAVRSVFRLLRLVGASLRLSMASERGAQRGVAFSMGLVAIRAITIVLPQGQQSTQNLMAEWQS
jgi:hypothetical protein